MLVAKGSLVQGRATTLGAKKQLISGTRCGKLSTSLQKALDARIVYRDVHGFIHADPLKRILFRSVTGTDMWRTHRCNHFHHSLVVPVMGTHFHARTTAAARHFVKR